MMHQSDARETEGPFASRTFFPFLNKKCHFYVSYCVARLGASLHFLPSPCGWFQRTPFVLLEFWSWALLLVLFGRSTTSSSGGFFFLAFWTLRDGSALARFVADRTLHTAITLSSLSTFIHVVVLSFPLSCSCFATTRGIFPSNEVFLLNTMTTIPPVQRIT